MIRSRVCVSTVVIVALSLTASSFAQERGRRGGRRFGGGFFGRTIDKPALLRSDQVRKELKIGEEQAKKIDEILASHREASREIFSSFRGFRDASEEEREKMREEVAKKTGELRKKTAGKLEEVLEKEQQERLNEIALQQKGVDGLVSDHVVASLKLSEEQVRKIRAAMTGRDEKLRELRSGLRGRFGRDRGDGGGRGGRGGFEEFREKTQKVRTEAEEAILALLSEEQREEFKKLQGEKFELDMRSLRGRGRFGDRGGRGRRERGGRGEGRRRRPPADDEV